MASPVANVTNYDVFLSFRGEDTRNAFTDHLYGALVQAGLRTFRDNDEIGRGEELKQAIERAIIGSRASIVVLSENYATSTWCLDELRLILEQRRECNHFVLPVFYHVDPSVVRKQSETLMIKVKTSARWTREPVEDSPYEGCRFERPRSFWGSKTVEGLALAMQMLREEKVKYALKSSFLQIDSLKKMDNLKLLQLKFVQLTGSYENVSEDLRWLCYIGFRSRTIPSDLFMGNLVALDMSDSRLEVFEPPMVLQSLKILNLKDSQSHTFYSKSTIFSDSLILRL